MTDTTNATSSCCGSETLLRDCASPAKEAKAKEDLMTEVIILRAKVAQFQKELSLERNYFLTLARGCTDYQGGHHDDNAQGIYQHGIQTVINVMESAVKCKEEKTTDTQIIAIERIGSQPVEKECKDCIKLGFKIKAYQTSIERYESHCRAQDKWVADLAKENESLRAALTVDKPEGIQI